MYLPSHHEEKDLRVLHALIQTHPLGAWVTLDDDGFTANHIPFILDASRGQHGTLRAHVARANPVWQTINVAAASLVIFQGSQTYITPNWYPTKQLNGKVVPTWNYTVVHAHGKAKIIHDREWLLQTITDLTKQHESGRPAPWKVSDAPAEFIDRLVSAIVGIEIPITHIVGKWKVSQDEAMADRLGTAEALAKLGDANSLAMSGLVSSRVD
ncbi:MAG: FMN-binding negative transcriptional regulator [Burkholderiaceae bacterium]|nr:FMN-binding negative transcriptional regulator [Burkholderiaceae bacterium]